MTELTQQCSGSLRDGAQPRVSLHVVTQVMALQGFCGLLSPLFGALRVYES